MIDTGNDPETPKDDSTDPQKASLKFKLYKVIRTQVEHEDELINHRITWLLISQTIIFTAFFTLLTTIVLNYDKFQLLLFLGKNVLVGLSLMMFSVSGIILVMFSFKSLYGAHLAINDLHRFWLKSYPEEGLYNTGNIKVYDYPKNVDTMPSSTLEFPDIIYTGGNSNWGFRFIIRNMFKLGLSALNSSLGTSLIIFTIWSIIIIIEVFYIIMALFFPGHIIIH